MHITEVNDFNDYYTYEYRNVKSQTKLTKILAKLNTSVSRPRARAVGMCAGATSAVRVYLPFNEAFVLMSTTTAEGMYES